MGLLQKRLEYAYDLTGSTVPMIRSFPIASTTVIEVGEIVKLSAGKIVSAGTTGTAAVIGVAAEPHDGSSVGQKGTMIKVYCSPTAVYRCKPNQTSVADSGSGTTVVDAEYASHSNDAFNGGFLKLRTKGGSSTLTMAIGDIAEITDFATTSGTFTGVFAGNVSAGDTFVVFPPVGFTAAVPNAASTNLDLKTAGGTMMIVIAIDTDTEDVFVKLLKSQLGDALS